MTIRLISFGFKMGAPLKCNRLIDLRDMRNPHKRADLRELTGLDQAVQDYVKADPKFDLKLIDAKRGMTFNDVIGIGCFGGRHRSVAMVEILARDLRAREFHVTVEHRELGIQPKSSMKEPI